MLKLYKISLVQIALLLVPFFCFSQKNADSETQNNHHPVDLRKAVSCFNCGKLSDTDTSTAKKYLLDNIPNLKGEEFSLEFLEYKESKKGLHYLFIQNYMGKPVYRGTVKINLDKTGNITSLFDNTYPILVTPPGAFPDEADCSSMINKWYPDHKDIERVKSENLYFHNGENLIPTARIEIWDKAGLFFERIINSESEVVYHRDLNTYFKGNALLIDTPAVARIFNPDPLTTAGVTYGTPYEDAADADISQLNMQRQQVTINVAFENDTFKLESPYCIISEHSIPEIAPVTSLSPDFEYTRSQDGFEDVNAFYHINKYHDYVESLGFNNIVNYGIWVDTHGMGGADNSNFSAAGSPPRLTFGEGGVDDAEDADVVVHEYGHAISHSAAPNTNSGTERNSIDEGLGDYFAASYSKSINPYNWENMFSWDGHNEYWNGRVVVSSKHYPENMMNQIYKDAELWSSTMMQISDDIGRERTDEILIEAIYSFATNMTMTDAANAVIQADVLLNGGGYVAPIRFWMCSRGFIPCYVGIDETVSNQFAVLNSFGFTYLNENAVVKFNSHQTGKLEIADISGRKIFDKPFYACSELEISSKSLESGIYLMKLTTDNFSSSYKLMKR